jgi:hypothetical protein
MYSMDTLINLVKSREAAAPPSVKFAELATLMRKPGPIRVKPNILRR